MHPIKYAALAHYKLVFIHPFSDGNGRTARLLMNFLLMQVGYVLTGFMFLPHSKVIVLPRLVNGIT